MKARDRIGLAVIVAFVVLAAAWMKVVSPESKKVTAAEAKAQSAHTQLTSAESELDAARSAQEKYAEAYASIVRLGKAVPAHQEVPALLVELEQAANTHHVEFASIANGSGGSSSSGPAAAKSATSSSSAGFTQMPFTFTFNGSFSDLYHLLATLQGFATFASRNGLGVTGRLLTIQGVNLVPSQTASNTAAAGSTGASSNKGTTQGPPGEHLTGTISATAYVLPASVGLTAGATPSGPSSSSASSASGSGSSEGAGAAPATIKAAP